MRDDRRGGAVCAGGFECILKPRNHTGWMPVPLDTRVSEYTVGGNTNMDVTQALDLGREALLMVLIVAAPVMGIGLVVGLVVSLFQSMTQLQEQTLSFVPKIVAMLGLSLLLIPWLSGRLLEYTQEMLGGQPF
ncbi:MAG TPA: flagellar biosynthesis protein FliQ [Phycisphaerae bacterium]|nr:flagellar biosynthesis protein FliQ [Phycisphaerae bacterium]